MKTKIKLTGVEMKPHVTFFKLATIPALGRRRLTALFRRNPFFAGLCALIWLTILPGAFVQGQVITNSPPGSAGFRTDRILVKPSRGIPDQALNNFHATTGAQVLRRFPRIERWQVLQLPPQAAVDQMLARYREAGLFQYAEPDYVVHALMEPNDFRYWDGTLWGLRNTGIYGGMTNADIHAAAGWDMQTAASNVIVAVIDTGARYTHEDLAANMWVNPGETGLDASGHDKATNGIDDDGDGFVDDVYGINAILGTGDPIDDHGHGTHVAGTIGAVGNNSVGVVGVAWRVQLMACKFIDPQGHGTISDAITCMDYARNKGAKIANASWGDYSFTSVALRDAVDSLRDSGVIFVAATGNNNNDNDLNPLYPASYEFDNVIAVAATDRTDVKAWFSNFGKNTVRLGAPGQAIFSCWNGSDSDYRYSDGTSMAAPHVAGACALAWAYHPSETHQEIINRILSTTELLSSLTNTTSTGGRLSLPASLAFQQPTPPSDTLWVDESVPAGSMLGADGGDDWYWVGENPTPVSGLAAHQSAVAPGLHEHYFQWATDKLEICAGDTLFVYVYLDPDNPPSEVMVSFNDGCWEHRAFWGQALIPYGAYGTSSMYDMGDLPPVGEWVRLEVPARMLGLEGGKLSGIGFMLYDGSATWDAMGRAPAGGTTP
jgi:subtilisin family serine protease